MYPNAVTKISFYYAFYHTIMIRNNLTVNKILEFNFMNCWMSVTLSNEMPKYMKTGLTKLNANIHENNFLLLVRPL